MSRRRPTGRPRRARRQGFRWRRLADLALAVAVLSILALFVARGPLTGPAETLNGAMRAADGDSLVHGAVRIRLEGIDAPELGQTCRRAGADYACGREAQAALARLVAGRNVSCRSAGHDRYDRLLARCTAGGVDLNRAMVEAGWAMAYGDYGREEDAARRAGRGLWAGSFERPQDWRHAHGGLAESRHDPLFAFFGWLRGLLGF